MKLRHTCMVVAAVVTLAGCGWTQPGFDGGRAGWNALDGSFTAANVGGLTQAWEFDGFGSANPQISSPVTDGQRVFVGTRSSSSTTLWTFAADGGPTCSGVPRQCAPQWTAALPFAAPVQPILAAGLVLVGGADGANWDVVGYDADGVDGCSGAPRTCLPVWRAQWPGGTDPLSDLELTAGGGLLFASAGSGTSAGVGTTYALDPSGSRGCSGSTPVHCAPLFSASSDAGRPVAVADGLLVVGSRSGAVAFDARGTTNCAGVPTVCQPLRRYATPRGATFVAVAGSTVYVGNLEPHFSGPWLGTVYGYDASGSTGCSGTPTVCLPRFAASAGDTLHPVVADGKLTVPTGDTLTGLTLDTMDVGTGAGCAGMVPFCSPVRTAKLTQGFAQIGATKSVLFALTDGNYLAGTARLLAFGVHGEGCHGTPVTCDPVASIPSYPLNGAGFVPFGTRVAVAVNATPAHGTALFVYALPS